MDTFGEEILVPIALFVMIVAIVWVGQAHAAKNRAALLSTVRAAIDRGVELSPEMIKTLGAPRRSRYDDIKTGLILISVAAAVMLFGLAISVTDADFEVLTIFAGLASFPGLIGLTLLGFGIVTARFKE